MSAQPSTCYPPIDPEVEPWISATQISTFELCNRKWAWRWLEQIKAPPNKFAQLGIDTHGELEGWLRHSRVPEGTSKEVLLAQAMIPFLPPPQAVDPANVERDELIVVQDVLFNIKVDLFMPQQLSWDGQLRPRTYDHKTTSDFKWCPRPEEIQYDPQAALYAAWTIIVTNKTEIDLQWNYVRTKGAIKVEPIYATVTDEMITPRMLANVNTGRAIKHYLTNTKRALDVVHDPRACDEYGGCPYREGCGISPRERIVSIMSDFKHQPATSQFLQNVGPTNGAAPQAVNPPQFQQPPAQFQVPQQAQQAPQQVPPQFQVPAGQQFAAPMQQPSFQVPQQATQAPQMNFGAPQQAAPSWQPPQQQAPQWQPPQQQQAPQQAPQWQPPQQAPQQFAPSPAQAPQPAPAQQFVTPQQVVQQPAETKPVGRPKSSKEHALDGAWAIIAAGAIQLTGGNVRAAAELTDLLVAELKARQ